MQRVVVFCIVATHCAMRGFVSRRHRVRGTKNSSSCYVGPGSGAGVFVKFPCMAATGRMQNDCREVSLDRGVCTENPIRIDWDRESPNVGAQ
jgi:hypothetical protein